MRVSRESDKGVCLVRPGALSRRICAAAGGADRAFELSGGEIWRRSNPLDQGLFCGAYAAGIECAYRLVYYWLGTAAISAPDAQAAWSHLYVWLPISAVILVLWALAAWRWYQWEAAPKTKKDKDMLSAR